MTKTNGIVPAVASWTRQLPTTNDDISGSGADEAPLAKMGVVEWFCIGEHERVDATITGLIRLGCPRLRIDVSWADYHRPEGPAWFDWLLPRLSRRFELLPCVHYTPPSLGLVPNSASPPQDPEAYAQFLDHLVDRYGAHFEWIQLWNEPNGLTYYDWRLDPQWQRFTHMIGSAAYWMKRRGRRTVLGGMCPPDMDWLDLMCRRGVVQYCDAVAVHAFPGTWQHNWQGWPPVLDAMRAVTAAHGLTPQLWITEAGYSTWRHDERGQIECFLNLAAAPAERAYWYSWQDLAPDRSTLEGFHVDERHYHFGLVRANGRPKLLHRALAGGEVGPCGIIRLHRPTSGGRRPVVITGGAGFLGTNLADRLAGAGQPVLIVDNLARPGVETNLAWLRERHDGRVASVIGDVRDAHLIDEIVSQAAAIFHFAAQVAVTTSVVDPLQDLDVNLRGTFNLLQAVRRMDTPPPLLFASTNKVYGHLAGVALTAEDGRWRPVNARVARNGIDEAQPLNFCSPYGCSKGAADQYVLDHARTYGLPATVLRMSCLYGPRQFGTEDQGWVAHFLISSLAGEPITIYGDGLQVRDILYVEDVVEAWIAAWRRIDRLSGRAFNIGGGPRNAVSLLQVIDAITRRHRAPPQMVFAEQRTGDQPYYVSNFRRFAAATGWRPRVSAVDGIDRLDCWLRDHWPQIASLRREGFHEGGPRQSRLDLSRQHLFRMSRAASSS